MTAQTIVERVTIRTTYAVDVLEPEPDGDVTSACGTAPNVKRRIVRLRRPAPTYSIESTFTTLGG